MTRWAMLDSMQRVARYNWSQCCYCGRAQSHNCQPVTCTLCGTVQCQGNGMMDGMCSICYHGSLGFFMYEHNCGYKGCSNPAIAFNVPRVYRVCREHLSRPKIGGISLSDYVVKRIAHRDSGKGWEKWREVE